MRILLNGLGNVGQGLVALLRDRQAALRAQYGFEPRLVGVVTRTRGALYHPDGLDTAQLLSAAERGALAAYPAVEGLRRDLSAADILALGVDALVEASPTDLHTGQPALDLCLLALRHGAHVVTANKGPVAVAYPQLMQTARDHGRRVLYEGTVMAGTPSLRLAQEALAGCVITRARGIVNGTTNYILTRMEAGMDYASALAEAQALGYAEADPTADVDGWDAAGKVLILSAALFGRPLALADMAVSGIRHLTRDDIARAAVEGERWKLIAEVTPAGGRVEAVRLPLGDPLAGVAGATNAITYETDLLGAVTLIGAGAGRRETGFALLADLLALHREAQAGGGA